MTTGDRLQPGDGQTRAAEVCDVVIEKWVYGGDALARIAGGRVVLVPFALPGERVRIEDTGKLHVSLGEVLDASPERAAPPCPIFTRCGGCHYQHGRYEVQLAGKVGILREQLRRVGKIAFEGEIPVVSGPPLGYRNRVQLHFAHGRLGYRASRSHDVVPLDGSGCPIASPRVNKAIAEMRERVGQPRFPRGVRSIEIFTNETALQIRVTDPVRTAARQARWEWELLDALEYATGHGSFRVSSGSFFQVNRFMIDHLVTAGLADHIGEHALDLYAGVGLFTVPLSRRFPKVTAVESGAAAARDLAFNAQRAREGGAIEVEHSPVASFLSRFDQTPDFVLADPPRAGLGPAVTREIERLAPPRLALVSCDPSTLARDLAALSSYRIETLTLVDLFPQTYHLEAVVHLTRQTG